MIHVGQTIKEAQQKHISIIAIALMCVAIPAVVVSATCAVSEHVADCSNPTSATISPTVEIKWVNGGTNSGGGTIWLPTLSISATYSNIDCSGGLGDGYCRTYQTIDVYDTYDAYGMWTGSTADPLVSYCGLSCRTWSNPPYSSPWVVQVYANITYSITFMICDSGASTTECATGGFSKSRTISIDVGSN